MTLALPGPPAESDLQRWAEQASAAADIAAALAPTPFVPDSLKVFTDRDRATVNLTATTAVVAAALLTGQEIGLKPMASLRSIDVLRGTPALRAVALRALVLQRGHQMWLIESTKTRCIMAGRRAGDDHDQPVTWTLDRAKDLQIAGFNDPRGPWKRQPQNMLVARATAELARLIAPDAILGLPYTVEEIDDDEDAGSPVPGAQPPPVTPPRRRAKRASLTATRPSPLVLEDDEPAPPDVLQAGEMITPAQMKALQAGFKDIGITDRAERLAQAAAWIGRDITSANDLYFAEAATVLDEIHAEQARRQQADERAATDDAVTDWLAGDQPPLEDEAAP